MARGFVTTAFIILASVVGVLLMIYFFQRNLIYFPSQDRLSRIEAGVPEISEVTLETSDGLKLLAWYHPAKDSRQTIVYFHGNGGNMTHRGVKVRPYLDAGYGLLLVEYRGYGGNPGRPTEQGLIRDARAALDFLKTQGVSNGATVLYGESIGAAVALHVAEETDPAGLVLEAPFTSLTDAARYHYPFLPVNLMLQDRFPSGEKAKTVDAPTLIVHGDIDRIVPLKMGLELAKQFPREPEVKVLKGAGHNDLYMHGLHRIVLDFLSDLRS